MYLGTNSNQPNGHCKKEALQVLETLQPLWSSQKLEGGICNINIILTVVV